jgi:HrpA-like RNA helicase
MIHNDENDSNDDDDNGGLPKGITNRLSRKALNTSGRPTSSRMTACENGSSCSTLYCMFYHPPGTYEYIKGDESCEGSCTDLHSQKRPKSSFHKEQCCNTHCSQQHPPGRQLCLSGTECLKFNCGLNHPPGRPSLCDQSIVCSNFYCMDLHPDNWNPCKLGSACMDVKRPHACHPSSRILSANEDDIDRMLPYEHHRLLKSKIQRFIDQHEQRLPILASKDEFCRRLKSDRMLIVIAETGSGKSTQLPQYAAEYFGGLVVCTQPRVIAAISLALRVAKEYDGTSVGQSVGYHVGGYNNHVHGTDIMFMTDSALIQESQHNQLLSKVKVLIIDEAHERSLNTDIVIGLANLLLAARKDDFYVVIASATINPTSFLSLFKRTSTQVLHVPGRVFDISLEYRPQSDDSTETHIEFAVDTALQFYNSHHEGNILVFLSGKEEIKEALEKFSLNIPDNCVALPLYGSLPTEELNKVLRFDEVSNNGCRMVVFCTNVAETSLTIKDTRLVIDSGWAEEARFDPKSRITIIETVRISKSSADQRKGQAGRTAPGHCIRLYHEHELTRSNIEPEIIRSSLDLTVLQFLRLQLDPCKFPYVDPPENHLLHASLESLQDLGCITKSQTITSRGKLFAELGIDPRLSAFTVDTYIEHGPVIELTAVIVAILTAPGYLFLVGGATKEDKAAVHARTALGAEKHNSDLLYLVSVYKNWQHTGVIDSDTRLCLTCQTANKRNDSCQSCRVSYSREHMLNNGILNCIEVASNNIIRIVTNERWQLSPKMSPNVDESDLIGTYLFKHFSVQHGHLLVPHLPSEGVYMVTNNIRAYIARTSVFLRRHIGSSHFIAMSITKLSTGNHVVERLHPLPVHKKFASKAIDKLNSISPVGRERFSEIREQINNMIDKPWRSWLVFEYDRCTCILTIWGEAKFEKILNEDMKPILQKSLDSLFARARFIGCGPLTATFESGLVCSCVMNLHDEDTTKNKIDLHQVPCKNLSELNAWLILNLSFSLEDIHEHSFQPNKESLSTSEDYEAPPFFVIFKSEEIFQIAVRKIASSKFYRQRLDTKNSQSMSSKSSWGRQLVFKSTKDEDEFELEKYIQDNFGQDIIQCQPIGKKLFPALRIMNMPANTDEDYVQSIMGTARGLKSIRIFHSDRDNVDIGSTYALVSFERKQECRQAMVHLRSTYCQRQHSIQVYFKDSRNLRELPSQPNVIECKSEPRKFLCTTRNRQTAAIIYSTLSESGNIDSSACVTISHVNLYPRLQELLEHICRKFAVKVQQKHLSANDQSAEAVRCIFTEGNPSKTAMAASMLNQSTSPIMIKLTDDRHKCLFNELFDLNLIQTWADELKLSCTLKDNYGLVVEIAGPRIEQGRMMRRVADYSEEFDSRYRVLDLSAYAIGYFGLHKAANSKLQDMTAKWAAERCSVTFIPRTGSITLYVQPQVSPAMADACEREVKQLLDHVMINDAETECIAKQYDFARRCAFCERKMAATEKFRICGHAYCRCASSMLNKLPLKCPKCEFRIHIQDIRDIFSRNPVDFMKLCKTSIHMYVLSSTNLQINDHVFCPNDECDGLVNRSQGYQTCLMCDRGVCGMCRVIDDELHINRTCDQRNKARRMLGNFLQCLFRAADRFISDSWPEELPPVVRVEHNVLLTQQGCKSLQRFNNGVRSSGEALPLDLARGNFAFHGTSHNAIQSICQEGFDPKRRRGQVHGPGEYFGITATISHGYDKSDATYSNIWMMILTFILRCDRVLTHPNFCYIVNNPVDWSAAFSLPVAVITYGANIQRFLRPLFSIDTSSLTSERSTDTNNAWKSPFRWCWCKNNGEYEHYNDKTNIEFEKHFERWKIENGPSEIITSPIIRYIDDIPQTYSIDFEANSQTNTKTKNVRKIQRQPQHLANMSDASEWRFLSENNQWTLYESMVQQTIEVAYQLYCSKQGPSTVVIRFPGRPEPYKIDFLAGRQINTLTNSIRLILRD